jgi:UPF0755 protein
LLAVLLFCTAGLAISLNRLLLPVDSGAVDEAVMVEIPSGASTERIALILAEEGIIRSALVFRLYARWTGQDTRFIAGIHLLSPSMGLKEVVARLISEDVYRETAWFTIPEGFTVEQIADRLAALGLVERKRFLELALQPPDSFFERFPYIGEIERAQVKYLLEGYLFPDTYEIASGAAEEEIMAIMLARMEFVYKDAAADSGRHPAMTMHQVLTLAAIVEKEAGVVQDQRLIAGIFFNRLAVNHALDSCATVNYVLGEAKEVLSGLDTKIESPYNTYKYPGLPPGPIGAPGASAIRAVFNPEETDYFYFNSKRDGSGESYFSRTLEEHNLNTLRAEENSRKRG